MVIDNTHDTIMEHTINFKYCKNKPRQNIATGDKKRLV